MKQSKIQGSSNLTSQAQKGVTNYAMANSANNSSSMAQQMQSESMQSMTSNATVINSIEDQAMANMTNNAELNSNMQNQVNKKVNKKSQNQQNGMY